MKKLCFAVFVCLISIQAHADYWGCDNLTNDEFSAARNIFSIAQEISLLTENGEVLSVKPADIHDDVSEFEGNFIRRFVVSEQSYGASDFFVRFSDDTQYINMSLLLGCQMTSLFIPKKLSADKSIVVEHSLLNAKNMFDLCQKMVGRISEAHTVIPDAQLKNMEKSVECYRNAFFEAFEAVYPETSYEYKKSLDTFINESRVLYEGVYGSKLSADLYVENRGLAKLIENLRSLFLIFYENNK